MPKDSEAWLTLEAACAGAAEYLRQRLSESRESKNLHWTIKDRWAIGLLLKKLEGKTE